jgi:hypothetical protein
MKTPSLPRLISKIAKAEGKKVETPVAQIREILKVLVTLCAEDREALRAFNTYLLLAMTKRKIKIERSKLRQVKK